MLSFYACARSMAKFFLGGVPDVNKIASADENKGDYGLTLEIRR